ncbi:MAG: hypothetical protein ABSF60_06030 [Verrucomicrobiota bacterium]|jgi:hypothetical protein
MNQIETASARSRLSRPVLVICAGIVFGAVCFFAGRLSIRLAASSSDSKTASESGQLPANTGKLHDAAVIAAAANIQTNPAAKTSSEWDENRWRELMSQPGTVARNAALTEMLRKLAATDPKRAMALAQAEGNLKLRADLRQAALSGWASTAPGDASDWALALGTPSERSTAMSTVFASAAAANPDEAVRVAKQLMEQGVDGVEGYGSSLIDALCAAGNFATAAQFAAGGDAGERRGWLGEMYSQWAGLQPEQAAVAAMAINDPDIQNAALHGVIGGWAEADPAALTQFLSTTPPGSDRGQMMGQALWNWVKIDPAAAADWINNSDMGADLDQGILAVASRDLSEDNYTPSTAVSWAESINDAALRSEALRNVLRNWLFIDRAAATSYFNTTTDLLPADREQIGSMISDLSGNTAQ